MLASSLSSWTCLWMSSLKYVRNIAICRSLYWSFTRRLLLILNLLIFSSSRVSPSISDRLSLGRGHVISGLLQGEIFLICLIALLIWANLNTRHSCLNTTAMCVSIIMPLVLESYFSLGVWQKPCQQSRLFSPCQLLWRLLHREVHIASLKTMNTTLMLLAASRKDQPPLGLSVDFHFPSSSCYPDRC